MRRSVRSSLCHNDHHSPSWRHPVHLCDDKQHMWVAASSRRLDHFRSIQNHFKSHSHTLVPPRHHPKPLGCQSAFGVLRIHKETRNTCCNPICCEEFCNQYGKKPAGADKMQNICSHFLKDTTQMFSHL